MTYGDGENDDGLVFFPDHVAEWLSSGSEPIANLDQLSQALDAVFYARAEVQLETVLAASIVLFPTPTGCSTETENAFNDLNYKFQDGILTGIKLQNQERLLADIDEWLS